MFRSCFPLALSFRANFGHKKSSSPRAAKIVVVLHCVVAINQLLFTAFLQYPYLVHKRLQKSFAHRSWQNHSKSTCARFCNPLCYFYENDTYLYYFIILLIEFIYNCCNSYYKIKRKIIIVKRWPSHLIQIGIIFALFYLQLLFCLHLFRTMINNFINE